jgi:hypothetical protein
MRRVHTIPTHLGVEDRLLLGVTARQLVRLLASASIAYSVWDQLSWLPAAPRAALVTLVVAAGAALALVQPDGRPLAEWLFVAAAYTLTPKRRAWRPTSDTRSLHRQDPSTWAELIPDPEWAMHRPGAG